MDMSRSHWWEATALTTKSPSPLLLFFLGNVVKYKVQLNLSTKATLGTEETGRCREV